MSEVQFYNVPVQRVNNRYCSVTESCRISSPASFDGEEVRQPFFSHCSPEQQIPSPVCGSPSSYSSDWSEDSTLLRDVELKGTRVFLPVENSIEIMLCLNRIRELM